METHTMTQMWIFHNLIDKFNASQLKHPKGYLGKKKDNWVMWF